MKNRLLLSILLSSLLALQVEAQSIRIKGKIISKDENKPLPGANIIEKGSIRGTVSDSDGNFNLESKDLPVELMISYIGYQSRSVEIKENDVLENIIILLEPDHMGLMAVEIVSTGFEELPRERATGSFVKLDQELVDRRVSTNILDRLQDITPGLIFNRAAAANDPISIRGRNTLFANTMPLVVIDNFPYDGPMENINPNDVESITVLRDAAAASIWGARAGNGVVIITTKKGASQQKPQVSFNSNLIHREKPDLFFSPQMDIAEFIEVERTLFDRGFYNNLINAPNRNPLSPAVETLIALRDGRIGQQEAEARLQQLKQQDVRRDLSDNFYRNSLSQQYAFSIRGGGLSSKYNISAGYDHVNQDITANSNDRFTLNSQNSFQLLDNKLELLTGLYFVNTTSKIGTELPSTFPYDTFRDQNGNPIAITRNYNRRFIESPMVSDLLDWNFIPINEIGLNQNRQNSRDFRINASLIYKLSNDLKINFSHQFWANSSINRNLRPQSSFFVRDLINQFTERNPDGSIIRNIPLGDILDHSTATSTSHNFRAQLEYRKTVKDWLQVNSIGGWEIKDLNMESNSKRYFGYDDEIGISAPVNFNQLYRRFHNNSLGSIPSNDFHTGILDRFLSYYFNSSLVMVQKYTISLSARRDASNLFGVEANQRAVPLWSIGGAWVLSEESFAKSLNLPFMKMRATYGFNGNVDRTISAFTTGRFFPAGPLSMVPSLPFVSITNPPNPNLRWERIGITNLALDIESASGRIRSTLELFSKKGMDLIGDSPMAPSTGVTIFRGNFATTQSRGLDFELNTKNTTGKFKWETRFFLSYINEKVLEYQRELSVFEYLEGNIRTVPKEGLPLFALLSMPWGGLNPENGNPMVLLDGEPSDNFNQIINNITMEDLIFHGPVRPRYFGSLINSFGWRGLNISFNLTYRTGHFFRRPTVNYGEILAGRISHPDFSRRWQNPGDEFTTEIPSMPEVNNNNRNTITRLTSNLVERGDNIRIQDIRLSYNLNQNTIPGLPVKNLQIYSFIDNVGIIWKATKSGLDPDFLTSRPLRSISAGIKLDF